MHRLVVVVAVFAALLMSGGVAIAAPIYVDARLSGDPRAANPDNIVVDVSVWWDPAVNSTLAHWTVDINSPLHPSIKLGTFGFNLAGPGTDYTFADFLPVGWSVGGPGSLPGSGNLTFMFVADDPPGSGNDVTNTVNLTFTMTKVSALAVSDFLFANTSCSNDLQLGCGQVAAHVQSLELLGGSTTNSGVAIGNWEERQPFNPIPEPASLVLLGTGLIAVTLRGFRRKK